MSPTVSSRREWIGLGIGSLPGLAAVIALAFTAQSLRATDRQLVENRQQVSINDQAEITDRFNAAITNLSSSNVVIQLGGIYALQRIMTDSPRDQPAVLNVLCAYVRYHDPLPATNIALRVSNISSDVQAALTVVGARNPAHDGPAVVDLEDADLVRADLTGAHLAKADLQGSNLLGANFNGSNLSLAHMEDANLEGSQFTETNLREANLSKSSISKADFENSHLDQSILVGANLDGANILASDLDGAHLSSTQLLGASVLDTNLEGAHFELADLRNAVMFDEEMRYAYLAYANLNGTNLEGADLRGATLSNGVLKGADISGANLAGTKITKIPRGCFGAPTISSGSTMTQGASRLPVQGNHYAAPC